MTLLDICPMETWEALEIELYDKFNLQGSVFNPEGIRITQVKNFPTPCALPSKRWKKARPSSVQPPT